MIPHDYVAGEKVEPTCTDDGYTVYTCSKCGDSHKGDIVKATGHHGSNGKCDACGKIYGFRCGFCDKYEKMKDIPVIGWFVTLVHFFVHSGQSIAPRT